MRRRAQRPQIAALKAAVRRGTDHRRIVRTQRDGRDENRNLDLRLQPRAQQAVRGEASRHDKTAGAGRVQRPLPRNQARGDGGCRDGGGANREGEAK